MYRERSGSGLATTRGFFFGFVCKKAARAGEIRTKKPKPKTETTNLKPEREMGKKREETQKKEEENPAPLSSSTKRDVLGA